MNRTARLFSSLNFALLIPLGLAACGGKEASVASTADQLRSVDPTSVNGVVPPCAGSSEAHPNVCCKGGPSESSACVAYVNQPFHKCDSDTSTYPDPGMCCDLNNPASCAPPPPLPPGGGHGACGYACPPGQYAGAGGGCCETVVAPDGRMDTVCTVSVGFADAPPSGGETPPSPGGGPGIGGSTPPSGPCGYPVQAGDSAGPTTGPSDPGSVPPSGPVCPPPPPSTCDLACPPGFTSAINDPAICCQSTPAGEICFSQAQGQWGSGGGVSGSGGGSVGGGGGPVPPVPVEIDAGAAGK